MPTFEIVRYELRTAKYRVEADSEADAVFKLFRGEGEPVDNSVEFVGIAHGMSISEALDLAQTLWEIDSIKTADIVIPSRTARKMD